MQISLMDNLPSNRIGIKLRKFNIELQQNMA